MNIMNVILLNIHDCGWWCVVIAGGCSLLMVTRWLSYCYFWRIMVAAVGSKLWLFVGGWCQQLGVFDCIIVRIFGVGS